MLPFVDMIVSIKSGSFNTKVVSEIGDSSKPLSVFAKARSDNILLSSVGIKINIFDFSTSRSVWFGG